MRENAPVDARFFQLFDFGLNLGTLNGLLAMQNHDTPVRELSQASGEASGFKIGYFCAIKFSKSLREIKGNRHAIVSIETFAES